MIVDGRAITKDILEQVHSDVRGIGRTLIVRAIAMAPSPATESYLRIKRRRAKEAGMQLEIVRLPAGASIEDALFAIEAPGADSIIVQLPLPAHIDTGRVLDAIPPAQDADVLSLAARTAYAAEEPDALFPPVVDAIAEILSRTQVAVAGKRTVVIGNGWLVGAPAARWLRREGAVVEVLVKEDADYAKLADADIVVSGAGSPGLIRPDMLKEGVVLVDAGTSESGGQVVGDALSSCADVASVFTPVPGGVGPVAVACLFRNAAVLAKRRGLHTS